MVVYVIWLLSIYMDDVVSEVNARMLRGLSPKSDDSRVEHKSAAI